MIFLGSSCQSTSRRAGLLIRFPIVFVVVSDDRDRARILSAYGYEPRPATIDHDWKMLREGPTFICMPPGHQDSENDKGMELIQGRKTYGITSALSDVYYSLGPECVPVILLNVEALYSGGQVPPASTLNKRAGHASGARPSFPINISNKDWSCIGYALAPKE